jgi:hypothetical protein
MWHAEHTLETTAAPEQVWQRVEEVNTWPEWDTELAWARLPGAFSTGAQGTMKAVGEGERSFLLASVVARKSFIALMRLPLAKVRHIHSQEASVIGTRMTHRIEIDGPLSWLYGWSRGRRIRDGLAPSMRRLARIASV